MIITTKNDSIDNQSDLALQFEHAIRRSLSSDAHLLSNIPIIHTSAKELVNVQAVLELALYACDEPSASSSSSSSSSSRKHSNVNAAQSKYIPPNYDDALRNEQSLKHAIQAEYRTLLTRYVLDVRITSWLKFFANWQHHTTVRTFINLFGKQFAEQIYDEHIEDLKRLSQQKLIEERLIPVVEMLVTDQKTKLSRYAVLRLESARTVNMTVVLFS